MPDFEVYDRIDSAAVGYLSVVGYCSVVDYLQHLKPPKHHKRDQTDHVMSYIGPAFFAFLFQ